MKKITFTLLLLCSLVYGYGQQMGCNSDRYFNTTFDNVTVTSNIQYGQNTTLGGNTIDLLMDIYEPTGDQLEKRPVIVFAHGGGFVSGKKEDITGICKIFAKHGFVTASINYRLLDVPLTDPSLLTVEGIMAVMDMKAAIRFIREDAATNNSYKIDPDFIFAGGLSAGAVMACNLGYLDSLDNIPAPLMALINSQGGLEGNSSTNTQYSSAVQGVLNYSGSIMDVGFIDADDPPLYSFHNELDSVVICGFGSTGYGSCEMHAAAEAVGIKNKFFLYSQSVGHVRWPYNFVMYETAQFLGEILCQEAPPVTAWEEASSGFDNPGFAIFDISVVNENVAWAISTPPRFDVATQNFVRTTDGGQTWETGVIPVSNPDFGIEGIYALDENTAWAITITIPEQDGGKVHKTTDGGQTWTEQSTSFTVPGDSPRGIHFFDENDGFALAQVVTGSDATGSHAGYITSDGGTTWEKLSSDVYPAVPGERFYDVNSDIIEARGDHLWIGMKTGKVFHSADRGHTWEVNVINTTQIIACLAFKDEMNGIAVSSFNTFVGIFFNRAYATSDGGTTWSEIPAPPSPALTGIHFVEGSADEPGACGTYIVFNGYDSGGSGSAYTTDGGQTWTFISEQPVYAVEFASPAVGWASGITHGPENGLFKWTGPSLTGNGDCVSSAKESIVDNSDLLIYPNPVADFLNIELENDWQGALTLRIVNTLGQEVFFESFSKNINLWKGHVDLSHLPTGMYQAMVSDGERMMVQPVVRE